MDNFQGRVLASMIILQPDRDEQIAIESLRQIVAPRHQFNVGQHLVGQFLVEEGEGEEVFLYPCQALALPGGIGGENDHPDMYEVRFLDEPFAYDVHGLGLNTPEEYVFQEAIDDLEGNDHIPNMEQLHLLRGSSRIQVAYRENDDSTAIYDENNFYYYGRDTRQFSTEAMHSLGEQQRQTVVERATGYEIGDHSYNINRDNTWIRLRGRDVPLRRRRRRRNGGNNRRVRGRVA